MSPGDMQAARKRLGLTLEDMATMLGYAGSQRRQMQYDLETGRRDIREPQRRLVEAYLAGYRPADWPKSV
jgi:transcriptional regulator with XRE-family HTH domain